MNEYSTRGLPPCKCPTCGYKMDAATPAYFNAKVSPRPGDLSLCMKCGEMLVFTESLTIRILELNDMLQLKAVTQKELTNAQKLIREKRILG